MTLRVAPSCALHRSSRHCSAAIVSLVVIVTVVFVVAASVVVAFDSTTIRPGGGVPVSTATAAATALAWQHSSTLYRLRKRHGSDSSLPVKATAMLMIARTAITPMTVTVTASQRSARIWQERRIPPSRPGSMPHRRCLPGSAWQQQAQQWQCLMSGRPQPYHESTTSTLQQQQAQLWQDRICRYNNGGLLNVRSPKQVALAVYGACQTNHSDADHKGRDHNNSSMRSVSRQALLQFAQSNGNINGNNKMDANNHDTNNDLRRRQQLATLIVQYRDFLRHNSKPQNASVAARQYHPNTCTNSAISTTSDISSGTNSTQSTSNRIQDGSRSHLCATQCFSTLAVTDDDDHRDTYSVSSDKVDQSNSLAVEGTSTFSPTAAAKFQPSHYGEPRCAIPKSSLEQRVQRLFPPKEVECMTWHTPPKQQQRKQQQQQLRFQIDLYWKEPLLQLTRPTAQALVAQLDASQCPMGYNPSATPSQISWMRGSHNNDDDGVTSDSESSSAATLGKKGTFLEFCREQKRKYPDHIVLVRCGDFYETFGVDAILLVECCGLNAMAGKAKAGCPYRNIQATLDGLTSQGFSIAVYEEGADTDASAGAGAVAGSKSRIKPRFLAQIVSAAAPTYMYDLVLSNNNHHHTTDDWLATASPSRQYVGILSLAAGYTMVEISLEERSVRIQERITADAVACRLAAYPPAEPLFYVPSPSEYQQQQSSSSSLRLPFWPSHQGTADTALLRIGKSRRVYTIPPSWVPEPRIGLTDADRAKTVILATLLQKTERHAADNDDDDAAISGPPRAMVEDFIIVSSSLSSGFSTDRTWTSPLYLETAKQLGLMNDPSIPSLVTYLVGDSAPAATRRFWRRWLLTPPPPHVADAIRTLIAYFQQRAPAMPVWQVPPIGKVLALLRVGQASAVVYGELLRCLDTTMEVITLLETSDDNDDDGIRREQVLKSLMVVLEYESGLAADPSSLRGRCQAAIDAMEKVISPIHHVRTVTKASNAAADSTSTSSITNAQGDGMEYDHGAAVEKELDDNLSWFGDSLIPPGFWERNEAKWRGRVHPDVARESYMRVHQAATKLAQEVATDFWRLPNVGGHISGLYKNIKSPIVQDLFNNLFAIKEIPKGLRKDEASQYIHPRDRFGKQIKNRYTTEAVQTALSDYIVACEMACHEVSSALIALSEQLFEDGHIPAIVQAAHANLILSSAFYHAAKANVLGWELAQTFEPNIEDPSTDSVSTFHGVWPYWMDRSEAVSNTFELSGMWILTAPNMSGKSTLMRSTAAAVLLSNCGLCAPLSTCSRVARVDHIFVRGASADIPSEQKSAFGAEMGDVAAMLACCGMRSMVFVDELGRGTSPRDGTRLAGAVLEAMAESGMSGIFATHLHDILQLPLRASHRIIRKRMAIPDSDGGEPFNDFMWTYRLDDGVCTDSMALVTAARFGLPQSVIQRAIDLSGEVVPDGGPLLPEPTCELKSSTYSVARPSPSSAGTHLDSVVKIAEQCTGQKCIVIPSHWNTPAQLDGKSCVYVLLLNGPVPRCYVGETDSLRRRLQQHRSKKQQDWQNLVAIAAPVDDAVGGGGKTQARAWESLLIQALAQLGMHVLNQNDGRRTRPSNQEYMHRQ